MFHFILRRYWILYAIVGFLALLVMRGAELYSLLLLVTLGLAAVFALTPTLFLHMTLAIPTVLALRARRFQRFAIAATLFSMVLASLLPARIFNSAADRMTAMLVAGDHIEMVTMRPARYEFVSHGYLVHSASPISKAPCRTLCQNLLFGGAASSVTEVVTGSEGTARSTFTVQALANCDNDVLAYAIRETMEAERSGKCIVGKTDVGLADGLVVDEEEIPPPSAARELLPLGQIKKMKRLKVVVRDGGSEREVWRQTEVAYDGPCRILFVGSTYPGNPTFNACRRTDNPVDAADFLRDHLRIKIPETPTWEKA